jgi:uncharacterized glyoxalase superfamily protein PhnB
MSGTLTPPNVARYLFYEDVDRAARFLEEAFGFQRIFASEAPGGGLAHAQLAQDCIDPFCVDSLCPFCAQKSRAGEFNGKVRNAASLSASRQRL